MGEDYNLTLLTGSLEKVIATGQETTYLAYDDGYYQIGKERRYERTDSGIVIDHALNLMWQDDVKTGIDALIGQMYINAASYCLDLSRGEYDDWRLPNMQELQFLIERNGKIPFLNEIFEDRRKGTYLSLSMPGQRWYRLVLYVV